MSLNSEQRQWLKDIEPTYEYDGDNLHELSGTFIVAPTQTGKSTLIQKVVEIGKRDKVDIAEVNTITTRPRRLGSDPDGYRTANEGITHEWMIDQIQQNNLVNWTVFETGDIYGTDRQSYPAKYNLLPAQEKSLRMLGSAGLGNVHIIYVVTPIEFWKPRIDEMMKTKPENTIARLQEAVSSLEYSDNAHGVIRIVNIPDEQMTTQTAESILNITKTSPDKYQNNMLADFHEKEFETHSRAMQLFAHETLRKAGVE